MLVTRVCVLFVVFFNDTSTTEIYTYGHTLSLHDALPICRGRGCGLLPPVAVLQLQPREVPAHRAVAERHDRSEENTSELQSLMRISYAVFCLKKKTNTNNHG